MKEILSDVERKILKTLKTEGGKTILELAPIVNMTSEGIRFNINKLSDSGFVRFRNEITGPGRPKQIWSLTKEGHSLFPNNLDAIILGFVNDLRDSLGDDAINVLVDKRAGRSISKYKGIVTEMDSLREKVKKLADIRNKEGYVAEFKEDDEGFWIIENHCPICAAAECCGYFCDSELTVFREILGEDCSITRIEHIVSGDRRCTYNIKP